MMQKRPLQLTARQQNLVAELMSNSRDIVYQIQTTSSNVALGRILPLAGDALLEWQDRHNVKPQEMDEIYDLMHRSGANQEQR